LSELVAEFIGTALLVLLGNGVVANVMLAKTKGQNAGTLFITLGWGLAVFVAVVVTKPFSGAHLNPAVTLGLAVANLFPWVKVIPFIAVQFLGGGVGALLVWAFYFDHIRKTDNSSAILSVFSTAPAIRNPYSNFFSEFLGTFVLVFTILYISGPLFVADDTSLKLGLGSVGAIPVACLVVAIGISLGGTTGYAINPARDFSPRLVHALIPMKKKGSSDWSYGWIPVLGPFAGGGVAALLFNFLLV